MAIYQFQSSDGSVIERAYPMREAPELGTEIVEDGKTFRRVLSVAHVSAGVADAVHGYPKRSFAAPQWSGQGVPGVSHDHKGHVYFNSPSGKRNYCKANPQYTTDLG